MNTPTADGRRGLRASELYRFFRVDEEETLALRGVSLTVAPGELVVVTGPSGSGKSTLLSCLSGSDEPDGGWVHVAGERVSHRPESVRARIRANHIGVLRQRENLFDHLTVTDNLTLVQSLAPPSRRHDQVALLSLLRLDERAHSVPGELSGGELVRAGLAIALANSPEVLLADEPTGELDSITERFVLRALLGAAHRGAAVLVASHSPEVASAAHRAVHLAGGAVVDP